MDIPFSDFLIQVRNTIQAYGYVQFDSRYHRQTQSLIGHRLHFRPKMIEELSAIEPLSKYRLDWARMQYSFNAMIVEAKENPDSRQLVTVNTDQYIEVQPCFLSMQFVKDKDGMFNTIVYQRSGDLSKLKDDIVYFIFLMKKFEAATGYKTKDLAVIYGNIHYTKE